VSAFKRSAFSVQRAIVLVIIFVCSLRLPLIVHRTPIRPYADTFPLPPTRFRLRPYVPPLVLHHRISGHVGRELFASMEKLQFNHKECRPDDTSDLLNQIHGSP
jgi:hypothetical protein